MRHFLVCLFIAMAISLPRAAFAEKPPLSVPKSGTLEFQVIRNGEVLGDHKFAFRHEGKRLEVDVSSDIEYRLFFIPFYKHHHRSREIWDGDRLVSMKSFTDDNGEELDLKVKAVGGKLEIDGPKGEATAPGDAAPASFWSATALKRSQIVSTLRGGVDPIEVEYIGEKTITVKGQSRATKHYRMTGGINRDLWFDPTDNMALVYLRFEAKDGSTVEYVLK
ncbi:MAG TPA: hypothetical protein DCS82_01765 [Rhodospirillaceae bacterium]|nr:hypothetical protein [Rhodospirillaceae bacterium]HAA93712.1 hypothetical protein [Rhodospirillaceae bacterium]HAT34418.1 hypothetical protein [Rhodospirillaceae bacterium]|tara:strand:+ start:245 stop:907 length:663 start_codon:yes stop_codon:yes gene_type:complete